MSRTTGALRAAPIELKADDDAAVTDALSELEKTVGDRFTTIEADVTELKSDVAALKGTGDEAAKTLRRIETKMNRPRAANDNLDDEAGKIERKAFTGFLRQGREALPADEVKALTVSPDTAGGYLAVPEFVAEVDKNIVEFSPIRAAARVGSTANGSVIIPRRTGRPTAQWVGETEDRTGTESAYGQAEIVIHEQSAFVDVSVKLLEDAAINVEAEIAFDLAEEFGRQESVAFVTGNGFKKPFGILTAPGVTYTPTGNSSTLGSNPADLLISHFYSLAATYRNRGAFMMNGATLAAIRKLKDGTTGVYLWQPAYAAGQPETILGRPVIEAVDFPDIGSGTTPIAFGDFSTAYRIYDRVALSILRDPYTQATNGLVRFHARRRVGADVTRTEAIKLIKCATS